MIPLSSGDLAQSYVQRRANTRLSNDLTRLATELTTGQKTRLGAQSGAVAAIDRTVQRLEAYGPVLAIGTLEAGAAQAALATVGASVATVRAALTLAQDDAPRIVRDTLSRVGTDGFRSAVAALNTQAGGRSLFAGTATDGPALSGADTMLDALRAQIAGVADPAEVGRRIGAWFAPGGGFDTQGYQGTMQSRTPLRVSADATATLDLRADAPEIRAALTALATVALADSGSLSAADSLAVARGSLGDLERAGQGIIAERAAIGATEATLEAADIRNQIERTGLLRAREDLAGADPFKTAVDLQQAETQLQTLYAMTARLSRLSLADYL